MTTRQIKLFYNETQRKWRREQAAMIIAVSAGTHGGDKVKQMLKELQK